MAKFNVHAGHCPDGKGAAGAVGLLKESTEARKVKDKVISLLRKKGHTVYDCTCDEKTTQDGCLKKIVTMCNTKKVKRDVSIHLNAGRNDKKGDKKTGGVEVYVYSKDSEAKKDAEQVCKYISEALGITNRGVKVNSNLYVLRKTRNPAMLIECCFVDDKDDAKKWDADECAKAIVKALTK